jgi:HD-GYP domain-containing protein (c-di-GMP phosphodiesterase class II)
MDGLTWESGHQLRIGRKPQMDIVLRDFSVDRAHAEVKYQGFRWMLRDLAKNPAYPTLVNHVPVTKDHVLSVHDLIQLGKIQLKVIQLTVDAPPEAPPGRTNGNGPPASHDQMIKTTGMHLRVQASARQSWDRALESVTTENVHRPVQEKAMLALVRANHHLTHLSHLEDLLNSILADTIEALQAQRGSIILAHPQTGELTLKATLAPSLQASASNHRPFSKTLVQRCFQSGESILCQDVNNDECLVLARSVRHGAMASMICALLRTPRNRLGVLHLDRGFIDDPFTEDDLYYADAIAASVAIGIETAQMIEEQRDQFIQAVTTLARAVDLRDKYTGDHTQRVTDYSMLLADELKLSSIDKYQIQIGTPLHDIGKIGIEDAILCKPGKLTPGEFEHMKTHTVKGATMLNAMVPLLPMIPIVRHHHERWDGSGYPDGLAQDKIPLTARIVSVADAFDAMTSNRPYRPALPTEQAFLELIGHAGTHFDPNCVYAFLRLRQKVESMMIK